MIRFISEHDPTGPEARFTAFVAEVEPRLRRALVGAVGIDQAPDAVADALTYAWAHWDRVEGLQNPAGYLYRVARSSARVRRRTRVRWTIDHTTRMPDVEPDLVDALSKLSRQQRTAVWLVHACQWSQVEVAEALDISPSAVSTHVARGLASLRRMIGPVHD